MSQPTVGTMTSWLHDVMETERRIIVVNSAMHELSEQYDRLGKLQEIKAPAKNAPSFEFGFISAFIVSIPIAVVLTNMYLSGKPALTGILYQLGFFTLFYIGSFPIVGIVSGMIGKSKNDARAASEYAKAMQDYREASQARELVVADQMSLRPKLQNEYKQLDDVRSRLLEARSRLYMTNYLDDAYHGFAPTAAMYGYLRSGRCTTIYGHGGIIDTYVHDQQFAILNGKLDTIISMLDDIRGTQVELARAIDKSNAEIRQLSGAIEQYASEQRDTNNQLIACQEYTNSCLNWIGTIQAYQSIR